MVSMGLTWCDGDLLCKFNVSLYIEFIYKIYEVGKATSLLVDPIHSFVLNIGDSIVLYDFLFDI